MFWSPDVAVLKNRYSGSATDHLKCLIHVASEVVFNMHVCVCARACASFVVLSCNGFALQIKDVLSKTKTQL